MHGFRRLIHLLPLALLLSVSCSDREAPTAPDSAPPIFGIADGAHSGGNPYFFFLPPLAADPNATGAFDASVAPHVTVVVCEWTAAGCATPLAAEFTTASGPGSETLRLDAEDEHYIVNWHTSRSGLDPEKNYRIRVLVAGTELGHLDVDVVRSGKDLKNVDTNHFVGVVNRQTVPIKFRIEEGAVYVVGPEARTFTTADGAVTLDFPGGALAQPTGITVLPAVTHPADPTLVGGTAYEFGPDGASFAHPVQLAIRYGAAGVPTGVDEALLLIHRAMGDHWREVDPRADGSNANPAASAVTGAIHGFSTYAVLRQRPVASVAVTPDAATIDVGETVQLAAALADAHGNLLTERVGRTVAWSSSAGTVATVDDNGLVTGVAGGEAAISAVSQGVSGSATVTVMGGGEVLLGLQTRSEYDVDSFGRRLTFRLAPTTVVWVEERCGEVDPQNVVLRLQLPEGTSLASESDGRGVYDAAARTVTWSLGTLDADDYDTCWGRNVIDVVVDVAAAVTDGAVLQAVAHISTSTPGDDPRNNTGRLSFQAGYLPVQVWLRDVNASCDTSESDSERSSESSVNCEGIRLGSSNATASSSASYQPESAGAPPRQLGILSLAGETFRTEARGSAAANSGHDCTISSCTALNISADADMFSRLELRNPNPYTVPLITTWELTGSASCHPESGGAGPAQAAVVLGSDRVVCRSSGVTSASGLSRITIDGRSGGTCEQEVEITGEYPRSSRRTLDVETCHGGRVPRGILWLIADAEQVEADAETEIVFGSGGTVERILRGSSQAVAVATIEFRLAR